MGSRAILAVLLLALPSTAGCGGTASAATPDGAVVGTVSALRKNDLAGFLKATATPAELAEMEKEWAQQARTPPTEEEAAQFAEVMKKLKGKDAVNVLYAEIEPGLAVASQQMAMLTGMLPMLAAPATAQSGVQGMDTALQAFAARLGQVNIGDRDKLKSALKVVTSCAHDLDVDTLAQVQALRFDQALERGGRVLGAAKQVLEIYGLSVDGALDSVKVTVDSSAAGKARVKVAYDLFGTPQEAFVELVEHDGRWLRAGN